MQGGLGLARLLPSLLAIGACRLWSGAPDETDSADPLDGDTDTAGPCGPLAPADCVALVDRQCFFDGIPERLGVEPLSDADIWARVAPGQEAYRCGVSISARCLDEGYVGFIGAPQEGGVRADGRPYLHEGLPLVANVYDRDTRAQVGAGELLSTDLDAVCDRRWYGAREAEPCFAELVARLAAIYPRCTLDFDHCDPCDCVVNEITEAQPTCVQP